MHPIQPVRSRPGVVDRHLGFGLLLVLCGLSVAILKPWNLGSGAAEMSLSPPSPPAEGAAAAESPDRSPGLGYGDLLYDPTIFGSHEPPAVWDLQPAAFLVTFGFVFAVPEQSARPQSSRLPAASGGPGVAADGGPLWPAIVDVPHGYHLCLIGLDMPTGFRLTDATLEREGGSGIQPVQVEELPAPWPDHFAVVAIPAGTGPGRLEVWSAGAYQLDLVFEPGAIHRTVEIRIQS